MKTHHLAALAVAAALLITPAVAHASGPNYVQPSDLEAGFQEGGMNLNGHHYLVLDASCLGEGYAIGRFPYQRYHIFGCIITTRAFTDVMFRVTTYFSRAGQPMFSYISVPG